MSRELADRLLEFVTRWSKKECPTGCLPTPGQERDARMLADVYSALGAKHNPRNGPCPKCGFSILPPKLRPVEPFEEPL
jgi:hypothetical protein